MADELRRDELLEKFDPTVNKVVGLIQDQVADVLENHQKMPKVYTATMPLWNDRHLITVCSPTVRHRLWRLRRKQVPAG